jgi:hypothetical protein
MITEKPKDLGTHRTATMLSLRNKLAREKPTPEVSTFVTIMGKYKLQTLVHIYVNRSASSIINLIPVLRSGEVFKLMLIGGLNLRYDII